MHKFIYVLDFFLKWNLQLKIWGWEDRKYCQCALPPSDDYNEKHISFPKAVNVNPRKVSEELHVSIYINKASLLEKFDNPHLP